VEGVEALAAQRVTEASLCMEAIADLTLRAKHSASGRQSAIWRAHGCGGSEYSGYIEGSLAA